MASEGRMRLDKWLWQARFAKSRSLSAALIKGRGLRLNGRLVDKPSQGVAPGDVLTLASGGRVRVIRIVALGIRRGPAAEAAGLYEDLG